MSNLTRPPFLGAIAALLIAASVPFAAAAQNGAASTPRHHPVITHMLPDEMVCQDCRAPNGVSAPLPPAHFNPLTASDEALAHYGFPPRPDANTSDYAFWKELVTLPVTRMQPILQATKVKHGPARAISTSGKVGPNGATGETSGNWSGYAVQDGNNPFKAKNTHVYGVFVVPVAQQAFGVCNGTWDYASPWVGFDGWGSPDVLQAGFDVDAYCNGGSTASNYAVWYEWYPAGSVYLSDFPIAPGDVIYVYVWPTGTTKGNYYIANLTQGASSSLAFNAPKGTTLVGNSVEWINEWFAGPMMTNYLDVPGYYAQATIPGNKKDYSPTSAPTGTILSITLTDGGNPISEAFATPNNALDYTNPDGSVFYYAGSTIWFQDVGAAK